MGPTLHGWISVQWAHTITSNSNYQLNRDHFYMHATEIVWQYILDCWTLCNQALHNRQDIPPEMHVLAAQVHHILDNARNSPKLAHLVPTQPAETSYSAQYANFASGYSGAKHMSTTTSLPYTNMLSYTHMTYGNSSVPSKPMTCNPHNQPKL